MSSVITVELDSASEAALKVLMAEGRSLDESVHHALVVAAKSAAGTPPSSDASDFASDDITGLA
jgi:hypothetical protein